MSGVQERRYTFPCEGCYFKSYKGLTFLSIFLISVGDGESMNEITIFIIGIGIGYFWAMYRKDNVITQLTIKSLHNNIAFNMKEFWDNAEKWRESQKKIENSNNISSEKTYQVETN